MAHPRDLTHIASADMAVLRACIPDLWPDAWIDFAVVFFAGLLRAGEAALSREAMARIALEQVQVAVVQIGGQQLYLPRGVRQSSRAVAQRVRSEFTGDNFVELAARYDLTEMRVRQIVKDGGSWHGKKAPAEPPNPLSNHSKAEIHPRGAASPFAGL